MYKLTIFAIVATAVFCLAAAAPQVPNFPERVCGKDEVKMQCATQCEPRCDRPTPGFCTDGHIQCLGFGCACSGGTKRNLETGKCVEASKCPKQ